VQSLSDVDQGFVFSSPSEAYKVVMGEYDLWRDAYSGLFYAIDVVGSDIEHHPECYSCQVRHVPEELYASDLAINWSASEEAWTNLFKIANRANLIMQAIEKKEGYQKAVKANKANDWTQLYGEAAVFRAYSYFNLIRYFGDVPYFKETIRNAKQTDSAGLTSRFKIYDSEIAHLEKASSLMYQLGQNGINAERFSSTFAHALIGKMALYAAGYSLLRTDHSVDYGDVQFEKQGNTKWNAMYARPTGEKQKSYYQTAQKYLKMAVNNSGTAHLITDDPRGEGFDNPFQYNFQMNMNLQVSPASLFEVGITRAVSNSERPYAFGRPSGGGSSNAYPCKSYGQSRIYASFYYGSYNSKDLRRAVTVAVTSNSGSCSEVLINFDPGSREKGGLANNKWDESRMADPYTDSKRSSGINWPQMRMADVILMLAEVNADLGQDGQAKTELKKVRRRSFLPEDQQTMVTDYVAGLSGDALKAAIQKERAFELCGEGFRRYDLIRTGRLPKAINKLRQKQNAMIQGLESQGFYTFSNGNTISNYIWVKPVNVADYGMNDMLTTQCEVPSTDPTYPIRYPGWRGNCNQWSSEGFTASSGKRNLAIQGINDYIDPNGSEAADLEAKGYEKTPWGIEIVNNKDQYLGNIFKGYPKSAYSGGVPPRYLLPIPSETIAQSNGLIKNGYGFSQQ
ncbi:MAG TPA: RagB/SusD family nutrient uptake outer membrane protein, partial [Chitinophagaceae bacterium]|nr:RagB/SusD family nutrient uptake outer membrane protein [Chitinophagaceae bacterium]